MSCMCGRIYGERLQVCFGALEEKQNLEGAFLEFS